MNDSMVATAPPAWTEDGRMTEQTGRLLLMNCAGLGKMRVFVKRRFDDLPTLRR